jgi:hypothetical protein
MSIVYRPKSMLGVFSIFVVFFAAIGGWVANIVKLFGSDFDPLTGQIVLRVVGVFVAPLGSIMGYL